MFQPLRHNHAALIRIDIDFSWKALQTLRMMENGNKDGDTALSEIPLFGKLEGYSSAC